MSPAGPVPTDILTDIRHSITHQLSNGSAVLMSSSCVYWHWADRTLCPYDYLRLQGWPDGLQLRDLGAPLVRPTTEALAAKRSRQDARSTASKVVDLAGNMMCIPDLAAVWYSCVLSCDDGTFDKPPPSYAEAKQLLSDHHTHEALDVPILYPHDMSVEEISIVFLGDANVETCDH